MNILILGYGQTGHALADQLQQQGHHVLAVSRTAQKETRIDHLAQDIKNLHLDSDVKFDWVYVILAPKKRSLEAYQSSFVDTAKPVWQALQDHPIQKIVFISSTRVYGQDGGQIIDDTTLPHTTDPFGQCLIAAEQLWSAYWQEKLIIVRPSGLYQANSQHMVKQALAATHITAQHWTNRIYREDLVGFLSYLLTVNVPQSQYLLSDQHPELQYELWNSIRKAHGLPILEVDKNLPQTGKRITANHLQASGYVLKYPTWKDGYGFEEY